MSVNLDKRFASVAKGLGLLSQNEHRFQSFLLGATDPFSDSIFVFGVSFPQIFSAPLCLAHLQGTLHSPAEPFPPEGSVRSKPTRLDPR